MKYFRDNIIVNGKSRWVIVNEIGEIINRIPTKEELKVEKFPQKDGRSKSRPYSHYTKKELSNHLKRFVEENGRVPVEHDFVNNPGYPSFIPYIECFGSWRKALESVRLDVSSMVKNGIIETTDQKARLSEMVVMDYLKNSIDLSGENKKSPYDGICPNGMTYDVKSSGLHEDKYWLFNIRNKSLDKIEIIYLLAFNEDYTELMYVWRVSTWTIVSKDKFKVWSSSGHEFIVENMKEYCITDKIKRGIIWERRMSRH